MRDLGQQVRWLRACAATVIVGVALGCSSVRSVDLVEAREEVTVIAAGPPSADPVPSIRVALRAPDSLGAVFRAEDLSEGVRTECFPVRTDDDVDAQIEARGASSGYFIEGFGKMVAAALERELGARYVTVGVAPPEHGVATLGSTVVVASARLTDRIGSKEAVVELLVPGDGDAAIAVTGTGRKQISSAHLAWELPVAILLMPIGTIAVLATNASWQKSECGEAFVLAIDDAAARMAAALVERDRALRAAPPGAGAGGSFGGARPPEPAPAPEPASDAGTVPAPPTTP